MPLEAAVELESVYTPASEPEADSHSFNCTGMRIYLDDERETPDGWVRVFWPDEAIALLKSGRVEEISLDHDLGDDERGTGYDVLLWLEEQVVVNGFRPPKIRVHSANSSARHKMEAAIDSIAKHS